MLRDRLVCGINNYQIQRRLWGETELKYQKAVELALSKTNANSWEANRASRQSHALEAGINVEEKPILRPLSTKARTFVLQV